MTGVAVGGYGWKNKMDIEVFTHLMHGPSRLDLVIADVPFAEIEDTSESSAQDNESTEDGGASV